MKDAVEKLFGTDGIRSEAGVFPLDPNTVFLLGQAAADVLAQGKGSVAPCCVVGRDTRRSGDEIHDWMVAGLNSRGVEVLNAGVVPTPAVAFWTKEKQAAFGIVISASHNPHQDNGIKFFGQGGHKLDEKTEQAMETRLRELLDEGSCATFSGKPACGLIDQAVEGYVEHVCSSIAECEQNERPLAGLRIALDSANGAAYQTSAMILEKLGAEVLTFFDQPNGENINLDCGCTHPATIEKLVLENGVDAGVSHDGDADRVCLCDETGCALDGDELLAVAGLDLMERGLLVGNTVVATTMSNGGLDAAIRAHGGQVLRTGVGDRQVIAEMRRGGYSLGGEQSGHVIFHPPSTTGDGVVAAAQVLAILNRKGKTLSELRKVFVPVPQVQRNLVMTSKPPLNSFTLAQKLIAETEAALGESGRVLLRYSGTEMLLRLLIEGSEEEDITRRADEIEAAIRAQC
jgi:phosphoglucosamine mutase